ncbi:hypothetical protein [Clostridium sp. UBA6640]|uniref:hypothetical protein n=1 Tax=Clostridium sp. UBA6640 TaxID=1946370 RepID=UPI0025BD9C64|nr:hypothetical protein [Clostridium sp. UBA6640]
MRSQIKLILTLLLILLLTITACNKKQTEDFNITWVKGTSYNEAIEKGLQQDGASIEDLLYEEELYENKIIFFTVDNSLGIASVSKDKEDWIWCRLSPFFRFESDPISPSPYMTAWSEITMPNGNKYYLATGRIYDSNISKLTLSGEEINAVIKEKDGAIFWFKLFNNKPLDENIKAYDKDGKIIE